MSLIKAIIKYNSENLFLPWHENYRTLIIISLN